MGSVAPVKIVPTALQDAASVAGQLVTTKAMIAEARKKESAGGGMDFQVQPSPALAGVQPCKHKEADLREPPHFHQSKTLKLNELNLNREISCSICRGAGVFQ
jgi:hypothetical protein